tara:strand:- start:983 stop:1234 length:252 start_codon:yes stop_codon:yes gene_type:complete
MFSKGSIVEYLVILGLIFISKISIAQEVTNADEINQRRAYKVKIISSELWHHGVSSKAETKDKNQNVIAVPEELELSLRRLED